MMYILLGWIVRLPVRTALLQNGGDSATKYVYVRLPVRTALLQNAVYLQVDVEQCDYQSERHCSKTSPPPSRGWRRAITSQNGTAPKRLSRAPAGPPRAITSQNGTAPKLTRIWRQHNHSAITSQNGTAPKHSRQRERAFGVRLPVRTALLQNVVPVIFRPDKCDYQSERHCSKTSTCF